METQNDRSFHWAWIILATCFVDLFINYSIRLGYGVVLPEMIRTLGFSRTAGGSIYNAYLFCYLALTPFTGYLTDRLGARRIITACSLILGIGVLLMGTITNLWMACLFYAIVGLGATGMWTPVITVVQRWYSPHRRGLALGILSTGYGLGFATMGAAFPWILHHFTWRHAWYFLGSAALVMVFANGLLLRRDPESAGYRPWGDKGASPSTGEGRVKTPSRDTPLSIVFRNTRFWIIGFSYFSIAYSLYGITTFMVDYAKYQLGMPMEKASLLATVHGFSQVIGVLTILPLSDYLGRKKTIIISNSFITASLFGILFTGNSWPMLFALVGILAVFYGVTFPIYGACAGDYFPRDVMGTVIGAWTPFYGIGAILSHWVTGVLRDATGIYDQAFLINGVLAVVGLILICLIKPPQMMP
ncbi:MAG: MFS transporter [Desulfobacteraceae bacterium]|jgi:sugar phosphate permease